MANKLFLSALCCCLLVAMLTAPTGADPIADDGNVRAKRETCEECEHRCHKHYEKEHEREEKCKKDECERYCRERKGTE